MVIAPWVSTALAACLANLASALQIILEEHFFSTLSWGTTFWQMGGMITPRVLEHSCSLGVFFSQSVHLKYLREREGETRAMRRRARREERSIVVVGRIHATQLMTN